VAGLKLLLDTHVALWWVDDPSTLSTSARQAIENPASTVWFSSASAWELSIKVRNGKLTVDIDRLVAELTNNGVQLLGIGIDDAIVAGSLEWDHRDPFDRMLVAQAKRTDAQLVTRDAAIVTFMADAVVEA
jgi:PIN domain nuclease of toxin-antitoxin system